MITKNRRDNYVHFRLNDVARDQLRELAASRELTVSAFVRGCVQVEIAEYLEKLEGHLDDRDK